MNGNTNMQAQRPQSRLPDHVAHALMQQAQEYSHQLFSTMNYQQKMNTLTSFMAKCPSDAHRAALQARHGQGLLTWFTVTHRMAHLTKQWEISNAQGQHTAAQMGATHTSMPTPHFQQMAGQGAANSTPLVGSQQAFTQTQGQSLHTPSSVANTPTNNNNFHPTTPHSLFGSGGSQPGQQQVNLNRRTVGLGLHAQESTQARASAAFGTTPASSMQPQPARILNITPSPQEMTARSELAKGLATGKAASRTLCAQHSISIGTAQMRHELNEQEIFKETFSRFTAYFPVCSTCRNHEITYALHIAGGLLQKPKIGVIDTCSCASHILTKCPFCDVVRIEEQKRLAVEQRQGQVTEPTPRMRCHCGKPAEYEEIVRKCEGCGGISTHPTNFAGERIKFYAATEVIASVGNRGKVGLQYAQQVLLQAQRTPHASASGSNMGSVQNTSTMTPAQGTIQPSNKRKLDHGQTDGPAPKRQLQQPMPQQSTPQQAMSQQPTPQRLTPQQPTPQRDNSQSVQALQQNAQFGSQPAGLALPKQVPVPQMRMSSSATPAAYYPQAGSLQIGSPATPPKKKRAARPKKSAATQATPAASNNPQDQLIMPPYHVNFYTPDVAYKLYAVLNFTVCPHTIQVGDFTTPFHSMITLLIDNHHKHIDHNSWMAALGLFRLSGIEIAYPKPQDGTTDLKGGQIMENLQKMGFMHNSQAQTKPNGNCGFCKRQHAAVSDTIPQGHISPPPSHMFDPTMPSPESLKGRKSSGQRSANTTLPQAGETIDLTSPVSSPKVPTPEKARAAEPELPNNTNVIDEDWNAFMNYPDEATAELGSDGPFDNQQQGMMAQPLAEDTTTGYVAKSAETSLTDIEQNLFAALNAERSTWDQNAGATTTQAPTQPANTDGAYDGYYPLSNEAPPAGLSLSTDFELPANVREQLARFGAPPDGQDPPAASGEQSSGSLSSFQQETYAAAAAESTQPTKEGQEPVSGATNESVNTTDGTSDNTASAANTTAATEQSTPPTTMDEEPTNGENKQNSTSPSSNGDPDFPARVSTPEEQAQADNIGTFFDLGEDEPSLSQEANENGEWQAWPPGQDGVPVEEEELPEHPEGIESPEEWKGLSLDEEFGNQFGETD